MIVARKDLDDLQNEVLDFDHVLDGHLSKVMCVQEHYQNHPYQPSNASIVLFHLEVEVFEEWIVEQLHLHPQAFSRQLSATMNRAASKTLSS